MCDFAQTEPTGIGFSLTCVNPLHFPLKLPLPEASTTLSATASRWKYTTSPANTTAAWPAKPKHGIPPTEWFTVQRRVLENQEPLRKVADDYRVSHETVRRVLLACRKKDIG